MFSGALTRAITAARTTELDHLCREVWRAHAAGILANDDAQAAAEARTPKRATVRHPATATQFSGARGVDRISRAAGPRSVRA
jgi:hypothetical protein